MNRDVIIACDFKSREELFTFLAPFKGLNPYIKIGMEMFYKEGPELVRDLKKDGFKIFLDLKLCDIPNTVKAAMAKLAPLGCEIINLHAFGGIEMMKAAREGLDSCEEGKKSKLIAVTILTSLNDETLKNELLIDHPVSEVVKQYATNAKKAGLDGVVCSALEAPIIKELGLISVTPGIRLAGDSANDQKRVATPAYAKELGATYIVVGRSITKAADPVAAYQKCVEEFR
ncbi:orotidine-5'-phosphate decarboxylase [Treponema rectale]|uniref:Orotidine 5'-phosphate decarboxylase n=1 Tax=Treponema rectale TaxID=744512 RepID=A0A7M1XJ24_9SPIR|nr:orotidine-5'-phosphate decarboxylase [Treponema rectale]